MTDVTTGTLLADRYRLMGRTESDLASAAAWQAQDQILDRTVRLMILTGPHAAAGVDEARRAALVADPRIVRTIDVGQSDSVRYVVTEQFRGDDLSILTSGRALPADQARAIIGEAASALDAAQKRGVNHLALRPHTVRVQDGRVFVTGLGVDGALNPGARDGHLTTARADVVGLVSLLFYALSASWPTRSFDGLALGEGLLLPQLAVTDSGEPDFSVLSADAPEDLVTLMRTTLTSRSDGPRTAGELADALGQWGAVTITPPRLFDRVLPASPDSAAGMVAASLGSAAGDADDAADDPREGHAMPAEDGTDAPAPGSPNDPVIPPPTTPVVRQSVRSAFAAQSRPVLPGTPPPAVPTTEPGRVARKSVLGSPAGTSPAAPQAEARMATEQQPASGPLAWAPMKAPSSPPRPDGADTGAGGHESGSRAEAPMRFEDLVSSPREYRRFRFNPTALTLVLALVAIGIGVPWALKGLTSNLTNPFATKEITRPLPTSDDAGGGEPSDQDESPSPTEAPITPIIVAGQQLDPQGDNNEHPEAVDRAFDQDPSTFWYTRTYKSPTFQGLGKDGIGFAVELEQATHVSTVYLSTNNTGGNVEIRATEPGKPTQGKVLASGAMTDEMTLELSETVETKYIVLWFTELPTTPEGNNRVELREITLT